MSQCKSAPTLVTTSGKLCADDSSPYPDSTIYHCLAGALQYLTFTRLDISYVVHQVYMFIHDPRVAHMAALHRILRYLQGTLYYGLQLYKSLISSLLSYMDANWGGYPDTRRSTAGYCVSR